MSIETGMTIALLLVFVVVVLSLVDNRPRRAIAEENWRNFNRRITRANALAAVNIDSDPRLVTTWHKSRIRRAPKSRIYWRTLYLDYLAYATDAGVYTVAPLQNVREYLEARGVKSGVAKKGEFAVGVRLA